MSSTREMIRAADDNETRTVKIPEWNNVTVRVKSMSAADRAATFQETADNDEVVVLESFWKRIMMECVLEEHSNDRVFEPADAEWLLSDKSADVINRLAEVCMEVSGLTPDGVDVAGKDSSGSAEATPNGDSTSASPAISE